MIDYKALIAEARDALKVEHDPNWLTMSELDARFAAFSASGLVKRLTDALEESRADYEMAIKVAAAFKNALDGPEPAPELVLSIHRGDGGELRGISAPIGSKVDLDQAMRAAKAVIATARANGWVGTDCDVPELLPKIEMILVDMIGETP